MSSAKEEKILGIVIGLTSTTKFQFLVNEEYSSKDLVFSYVEIRDYENNNYVGSIIARITDVKKENALISEDTARVLGIDVISSELRNLSLSKKYSYSYAECEVVGYIKNNKLEPNRKPISPGKEVYPISQKNLESIFYSQSPSHIPIGRIQSFGDYKTLVTLDGDELTSKHFAIFGMTGSGKTTTAARIIEELYNRLHTIVIFDPHDEYVKINDYSSLLRKIDTRKLGFEDKEDEEYKKFLQTFLITGSIVTGNKSIYSIVPANSYPQEQDIDFDTNSYKKLTQEMNTILNSYLFKEIQKRGFKIYKGYPKLKCYRNDFMDFAVNILWGLFNMFPTSAQRRETIRLLRIACKESTSNLLESLKKLVDTLMREIKASKGKVNRIGINPSTLSVISSNLSNLELAIVGIEKSLKKDPNISNIQSIEIDIEELVQEIVSSDASVFVISLSDLPENIRKVFVHAVVEYTFRLYKTGEIPRDNRKPILFILEEARTLIPRNVNKEEDFAGFLSVRAVRNLAFEGRKFGLSYGLVSQKPSNVDEQISSQCNTLILHQLRNPDDQEYVKQVTEGLSDAEIEMIKNLGTGRAIITGSGIKLTALVKIENRYSEEGIQHPKPVSSRIGKLVEELRKEIEKKYGQEKSDTVLRGGQTG